MLKSKNISVTKQDDYYCIKLDESFLQSPEKNIVTFKNKSLALKAIDDIKYLRKHKDLQDYSILKISFTLLDRVQNLNKEDVIKDICNNFVSDSVLYWSQDEDINKLEQKHLNPVIDSINSHLSANFSKTTGLTLVQGINTKELNIYLQKLNKKQLWVFNAIAHMLESVGIAYLIFNNLISFEDAYNSSFLHDLYSLERWGKDKLKQQELENKKQMFENLLSFIKEL